MSRWITLVWAMACMVVCCPVADGQSFLKKRLNEWREDLKKPDRADIRRSAAFALGQIGPTAVVALDELLDRVKSDDNAGVREMSARAVGDILTGIRAMRKPEGEWEKAGTVLENALNKDTDPRVRRSAAYALGCFGEVANKSLPSLRAALRGSDAKVKQNAAWAVGKIGDTSPEAVRELSALLSDGSPVVRRLTAGALAEVVSRLPKKTPEPALALLKMLKDEKDDVVCRTALGALATMTDESLQKFAPDIYPLLESKDVETARSAAFVLGNMGGDPAVKALPYLQKALADPDPNIQVVAAACLANSGQAGAPATDLLAQVMQKSKNYEVRSSCAVAIGLISEALYLARDARAEKVATITVPALVVGLKTSVAVSDDATLARSKQQLREDAAEALSRVGYPYNEPAYPVIREIIRKDGNQIVRQRAIWSLYQCDDLERQEEMKKVLTEVLDETSDPTLMVRYDAARLMATRLKEKAPDKTIDVLLDMLGNTKLKVFYGSGTSVKNLGSESGRADANVTVRKGGDARYMAVIALGNMIGKIKKNEKVLKAIADAAKDSDPQLKKHASSLLEDLRK